MWPAYRIEGVSRVALDLLEIGGQQLSQTYIQGCRSAANSLPLNWIRSANRWASVLQRLLRGLGLMQVWDSKQSGIP